MTVALVTDVGLVGATIVGRYELLELLGSGGMGDVYRALDRDLDETIALKVVRDEVAQVPGVIERFRAEVKLARRVTHRNVARTFELGHGDGLVYFTMELVEGESLASRLRAGPLSTAQAIDVAVELCDALAAAHAVGVIHRDLKPDNVLLATDGRVVLTDFGVAALARADDQASSGTPRYMAPEQARGEPPTPLVDVYALGLVLYEMVTGQPAFVGGIGTVLAAKQEADRMPAALGTVDPGLAAIIARAIAVDPHARWRGVADLAAALAPDRVRSHELEVPRSQRVEHGLPTVVVLPGRSAPGCSHLIHGLHDELLRRLTRRSRLRLVRRSQSDSTHGIAWVAVDGSDRATVAIGIAGRADTITLSAPLEVDALVAMAELASRVIAAAVGAGAERGTDEAAVPEQARAHLWRALDRSRFDETDRIAAHDDFVAAAELAPNAPRILAGLAIGQVRLAFFSEPALPEHIVRAEAYATAAIAAAPHEAEAHVAYGRVRLHLGDATAAAIHFRIAIARAPYLAEAHEWLGRMLLEAGFLVDGMARIHDVLDMDPSMELPRWDLARAYALEGQWAEHDAIVAELGRGSGGTATRFAALLRTAAWRGDLAMIARVRAGLGQSPSMPLFERSLILAVCDAALDGRWDAIRQQIVAAVTAPTVGSARRRAFVGQIIAEVAGGSGDVDTALVMIRFAIEQGLFDRHWMEKCPVIAPVRADPRFAPLHELVVNRAHAILDALYGDHSHRANADTMLVSTGRR